MKLIKKEKLDQQFERWDISVQGTHNYLVEGIVVHNSNCRLGLEKRDGELIQKAGSHKVNRKRPSDEDMSTNTYWCPWLIESVSKMINALTMDPSYDCKTTVTLFGEVYGRVRGGHKSLHYGIPNTLGFAAFNLQIDGKYVDWSFFKAVCDQFQVPTVPVIEICPFDFSKIKELSKGNSLLAAQNQTIHLREGIVVQPFEEERHDPKLGRVILKLINDDYIILKNKEYEKGQIVDFTDV